jgi:hypothetical protein
VVWRDPAPNWVGQVGAVDGDPDSTGQCSLPEQRSCLVPLLLYRSLVTRGLAMIAMCQIVGMRSRPKSR